MKPTAKCDFPIVLVFHSSSRTPWNEAFEGMSAYAKEAGWKLQLVEEPVDEVQVDRMIQFWRPLGCIAECGCDIHGAFSPQRFNGCPSVFMNPVVAMPKATSAIMQDNRRIGALAARELAGLRLDHFAFLGFSDYPWSQAREEGFLSMMSSNGVKCDKFLVPHVGVSWNEFVESAGFAGGYRRLDCHRYAELCLAYLWQSRPCWFAASGCIREAETDGVEKAFQDRHRP